MMSLPKRMKQHYARLFSAARVTWHANNAIKKKITPAFGPEPAIALVKTRRRIAYPARGDYAELTRVLHHNTTGKRTG
jgi:hypothetical protein